ncbi:hypothetical protein [Streptomyces ortus]|uniref:Phage tail protein n=1 Tax=Streptomyces ortus TaxID=2867268 RepID=A0ABT3V1L7_9ACTN|nr:hypothetical protein [Streptomyces ortus]MCX4232804.1 hypothetical protein [Streptomyces ortus]
MAQSATNLIAGPALLYTGAFGATEPADTAVNATPAASAWTEVGFTQDGVKLVGDQAFLEFEVDQTNTTPERRQTKQDWMVETTLAEATLENLSLTMNGGTTASGAGFKSWEPNETTSATQPTYKALIMDGYAPQQFRRRAIVRKALSTDGFEVAYVKDKQTVLAVKWAAHWVSSSIRAVHIVDQTS